MPALLYFGVAVTMPALPYFGVTVTRPALPYFGVAVTRPALPYFGVAVTRLALLYFGVAVAAHARKGVITPCCLHLNLGARAWQGHVPARITAVQAAPRYRGGSGQPEASGRLA